MPWESPASRGEVDRQMNVRIQDRLLVQIEWLANEMEITKRQAVETALEQWATREIKRRGKRP